MVLCDIVKVLCDSMSCAVLCCSNLFFSAILYDIVLCYVVKVVWYDAFWCYVTPRYNR